MVEVLEFKDELFGIYNTGICKDCWVVKASLRELLKIYKDTMTGLFLRKFYALTQILTPNHPDLDNIEFYFVFENRYMLEQVPVYVVFRHFEHDHVQDLYNILSLTDMLAAAFNTESIHLQEFNANGEHMILVLYIEDNPQIIAELLKPLLKVVSQ